MTKLVIALLLLAVAVLLGVLVFAQPDWITLNPTRTLGLSLAFGFGGLAVAKLPPSRP